MVLIFYQKSLSLKVLGFLFPKPFPDIFSIGLHENNSYPS